MFSLSSLPRTHVDNRRFHPEPNNKPTIEFPVHESFAEPVHRFSDHNESDKLPFAGSN